MKKHPFCASIALAFLIATTAGALACRAGAEPPAAAEPASTGAMANLRIEGMTCASCTTAVRIALKKLDGVREVRVSYEDKRAAVEYVPSKVKPEQLAESVETLGYEARVVSP